MFRPLDGSRSLSNGAIAARLVICEGTVKSHIKQILRKIGAVNRSEAIAGYLGMVGTSDLVGLEHERSSSETLRG